MNEEKERDILISLTNHENRLSELYHRIKIQEQQTHAINELSLSVKELAVTMKSMVSEQKSQGERITKLEKAPLARYEKVLYAVFSALLGFLSALAVTVF